MLQHVLHCSKHRKDISRMLRVLKLTMWCFVVDKLQFEPPLRKETEARDEMVRTSLFFPSFTKIIAPSLFCGSTLSNLSLEYRVMRRLLLVLDNWNIFKKMNCPLCFVQGVTLRWKKQQVPINLIMWRGCSAFESLILPSSAYLLLVSWNPANLHADFLPPVSCCCLFQFSAVYFRSAN